VLDCSPTYRGRELGLDRREVLSSLPHVGLLEQTNEFGFKCLIGAVRLCLQGIPFELQRIRIVSPLVTSKPHQLVSRAI